jgi:predicted transcriptional regulator
MYDQRLQLLLSLEQRRRVEAEARRRDASVASVIREAIDAHLGTVDRAARLRAVEEIAAMRAGPFLTPEELNRIVEEEREAQFKL